jgi:hypothetical protein
MNDVTTFLLVTAATFAVIIVLLFVMSHLESKLADHDPENPR